MFNLLVWVLAFSLPDLFREFVYSNNTIIVPLIFIGFFVLAFIAVLDAEKRHYITVVVVVLMLVSSMSGVYLIPAIHAQRYSDVVSQMETKHNVVIVDESGDELGLDECATNPIRVNEISAYLLEHTEENERLRIGEKIIEDSEDYRQTVLRRTIHLTHPPNRAGPIWTRSALEGFDQFIAIRIYSVDVRYEVQSHRIAEIDHTCVLEIFPDEGVINENCTHL